MAKRSITTDALHPARLLVSAALSAAEFSKKFRPTISNTPDLPKLNWDAIQQLPPQVLETPPQLPAARAVVITWAEPEWAAMEHVFCSSGASMPYSEQNKGSWSGWVKYIDGVPAALAYWGYYRLVQIGTAKVLLFKSNTHYAASEGEQNLEQLIKRLIQLVNPQLLLSIGTAGGARAADPIGTVNVVHSDALYESNQPQNHWPRYSSPWAPAWTLMGALKSLLFPIPTTTADLNSIVSQFNQFYGSEYSLDTLNPDNLNMGAPTPAINDLTKPGTALVTAKSFVVGNTSGNLADFACVEMDDAIVAKATAGKVAFGSIRNISDPIQNAALPELFQGHWGEAIYTAYGMYTSHNGAVAAWAVLSGQFAASAAKGMRARLRGRNQ